MAESILEKLESLEGMQKFIANFHSISEILAPSADVDIARYVMKLNQYPDLADLIIKHANIKLMSPKQVMKELKSSVVYIGIPAVQNIILYYFTKSFFTQVYSSKRKFDFYSYWRHVLGTAVAGRMLSSGMPLQDSYKIFTYGLIHDLGISVMSCCMPELMDEVFLMTRQGKPQVASERAVFNGLSHQEIGAWLCLKLGIHRSISDVIEFHHQPHKAPDSQSELLILHIADLISTEYYQKLLGIKLNSRLYDTIDQYGIVPRKLVVDTAVALPREVEKLEKLYP